MTQRIYYSNGRKVTRTLSIKFKDREVHNPVLRVLLGILLAVAWLVMMLLWYVMVALMIVLSPVLATLHLILLACGRNGFVYRSGDKTSIQIDSASFRKTRGYRYY